MEKRGRSFVGVWVEKVSSEVCLYERVGIRVGEHGGVGQWRLTFSTEMSFLNCNAQSVLESRESSRSIHGLKHQTTDIAHGITVDMYEPTSLRRNDLLLLGLSNINERKRMLGRTGPYGDSIYPHLSNVFSSHRNANMTERQMQTNQAYKSIRVSIEWNYGVIANLFTYFFL